MSALLFCNSTGGSIFYPDGLVEIVQEVKEPYFRRNRQFIVKYTDPWMGDELFVAFGEELQLTT